MSDHPPTIIALFCIACLASCSEVPRAASGFQEVPTDLENSINETPSDPPSLEERRKRYEATLNGRICFYAIVVDQDGTPVPDALVLIGVKRLGWKNSEKWNIYTRTDSSGKFSVFGGEGTKWSFAVVKKGYSRSIRYGDTKGPDMLFSPRDAPQTIVLWKITGFDQTKLIKYRAKDIRIPWPPPASVKIALASGAVVSNDEEWDIEIGLGDPTGGDSRKLTDEWIYGFRKKSWLAVNAGKLTFLADPLPGRTPFITFVNAEDVSGIVDAELRAERLSYPLNTECRAFEFKSRNGKAYGLLNLDFGFGGAANPYIKIKLSGAVNPTGSPALFEREPTESDLSTDGFEESKW